MKRLCICVRWCLVLPLLTVGLGPVMAQGTPPWETPGNPFQGDPGGYARSLHSRYLQNHAALNDALARLAAGPPASADTDPTNPAQNASFTEWLMSLMLSGNPADMLIIEKQTNYQPAVAAYIKWRFEQRPALRRDIVRLEEERNALESEWLRWCENGLGLGHLWEALPHFKWVGPPCIYPPPGAHVSSIGLTVEETDLVDARIRALFGRNDPVAFPLVFDLGTLEEAGTATITPANRGGLSPGQQIMQHGGSFPGKADDQDLEVGPFFVPEACTIQAHVVGNPPVPRVWSLGNSNTGMAVWYERRLGLGATGKALLIGLKGQTTDNDLTGEADVPGPGMLTVVFGHPRGSGPLSGGNFPQGFQGSIKVTKIAEERAALAQMRLANGDRLQTGDRPSLARLPDGSSLFLAPHSDVSFSGVAADTTSVNLERGALRIAGAQPGAKRKIEVSALGRTITPEGTDYIVTRTEREATVDVVEGKVTVSGAGTVRTALTGGQRISLPGGATTTLDAGTVKPSLVLGLTPEQHTGALYSPQPYGDVDSGFTGDRVGEGWLWEDPDTDAQVQTPVPGTLRVTVPHGNDLWEARTGAPRLLHKVTGDFDLEGELLISTKAKNWVSADFLVKAPGSYLGACRAQMPLDGAGAHYWIPAGCWSLGEGNFNKLTRLNQERLWQGVDAPSHPVRVRMTRRGDLWKAYWSVDGETWNVCSVQDAQAPKTVFIGWVFKRWAGDGPLGKEPGVFTLRDIRLHSVPLGTGELPGWDTFCLNGSVAAEGPKTRLTLSGKTHGEAHAISAGRLTGNFDLTIGYDTGQWTPQPGETRHWFVAAATGDEKWRVHIGGMRSDATNPQRLVSHARLNGTWGSYATAPTEAHKGRFRLVRQDGVVSTFYDVGAGWKELGERRQGITAPLHLWLEANSTDKAKSYPPFAVVYTIEAVAPPLLDTNRLVNEKPRPPGGGQTAGQQPGQQPQAPATGTATPSAADNSARDACLANLKELALALLFYANDHDDRLPDSTRWMDEIKAYVKDEGCFKCPAAPHLPYGYAMNSALSKIALSAIAEPQKTVLLYEADLGTRNASAKPETAAQPPRHNGVNHVAYADGSCTERAPLPIAGGTTVATPPGETQPPATTAASPGGTKPPTTATTPPSATVVLCLQLDEQQQPINPGTVLTGPAGAVGAPGQPGLPGRTPDTVRAVCTHMGVPVGSTLLCVWEKDGKEFARAKRVTAAGETSMALRLGPREGGLPAGSYEISIMLGGQELVRQPFQILAGAAGPAGPATAPVNTGQPVKPPVQTTTPVKFPVQGANLLTPAALPEGLRMPTGTTAEAFAVPFDLGRPFVGPRDELFLLTCDRTEGMILHVPAPGVMQKVCESAPLRGSNFRGAAYRDGRFVVAVDYAPAGGSSVHGVHEVMLDGSSRPWPLQREYPGLGDLIPSPQGGFYISDFERAENIFHLTAPGKSETQLVARNWPGGIMRLAYDPTQKVLYALNWGRDGWGGTVNGVYRLVGEELQLVSQAPSGMTFDDLAISPGGAFAAGLYVTDFRNGRVLRIVPGGAPVPVVTGLHQPDYIGFVPATGELMIVCKPKSLLWLKRAR